jgi:hypothetical protein
MPRRQPSFFKVGYAHGSGIAPKFWAKGRTGGIAPNAIRALDGKA